MMFWQYAREVKSNRQTVNRPIKLMQAEYNTDNVSLKPTFSFRESPTVSYEAR